MFASARVQDVFGYSPDELVGAPVETLLPERHRAVHRGHRRSYVRAPRARPMGRAMELLGRHQSGSEFPVEISLSPLWTDQGLLVTSTIRDISERKQTEASLARERALLDSMIRTAPTIVLLLDSDGRVEQVNPYLEQLSGYSQSELVGRDWLNALIPEQDHGKMHALFQEALGRGSQPAHVNPLRASDGTFRHVEWLAKTLHDEHGDVTGLLCIGHDVTEQLVHQRELREAREEADRANASKSRFLAAASHDLRQPLQSLGLYLSVLTRLIEEHKPLEVCGKMRLSLDTMKELLDALLDISRLDSGSVTPQLEDFALDAVLDRILTDTIQQAHAKGLTLDCRSSGRIVHSDPGLLERVIENLVINAIRYTEQGGVTITCEPMEDRVRVSVCDTGIGIPEDALERIFDEYYQLDNSVRDRRKGLGLGLSIVRHIANMLELTIGVTSAVGQGSTFTVDVAAGSARFEDARPRTAGSPPAGRQPEILFVEDDEAVTDATVMLLESSQIRVHSAVDGNAALDRLAAGVRPDLLICDYRLPGMTGVEVALRVQRALSRPIPVVIMTGDTTAKTDVARVANCTTLHKPADPVALLSLVEAALGVQREGASP